MRVAIGELGLKDAYKSYKTRYPKGHKYYCTYQIYSRICKAYNKEISRRMLDEGEKIQLPYKLSTIRVCKYPTNGLTIKQGKRLIELKSKNNLTNQEKLELNKLKQFKGKRLNINWGEFHKSGKFTYHLNEHSDGYQGYFFWHKAKVIVKNKQYYRFIPCRHNKRWLAKNINSPHGHKKYAERDYKFKL